MKHAIITIVALGSFIFYLCCSILSPPDPSLTGDWNCSLFTMIGPSNAKMKLKEKSGKVSGTFKWQDLDLPLEGTVNSKRQVNMETQDPIHRCIFALRTIKDDFLEGGITHYIYSEENQASMWVDGGSIELRR